MSKWFQSEMIDEINKLAEVLILHLSES